MTIFGSNGVRGTVNDDLTPEVVLQLGKAIGRSFQGTIALATDARDSAVAMKTALASGIMSSGSDVVDLGILPTPALQHYVSVHSGVSGGVMITASHNPYGDNGLKIFLEGGAEATREDEQALETFYSREIPSEEWSSIGEIRTERGAAEDYVQYIVDSVDSESIRAADLTICIDCANGAASVTTPLLLRMLGVKTVALECDPEGMPRRESDPTRDNLSDLMFLVPHTGADLGLAHDSDGGRAVFIDGAGRYIEGDYLGALVAERLLADKKGKIVTPVSSSRVLEDTVEASGGQIRYTEVGTHAVVRKMIENLAILGVEEDGGLIFQSDCMCRDGGMALAKVLEMIAGGISLADMVDGLPVYHKVKRRIPCPDDAKAKVLDAYSHNHSDSDAETDIIDGLKIMTDTGWTLVRPSTTEDYIRVYAESSDEAIAASSADEVAEEVTRLVSESIN